MTLAEEVLAIFKSMRMAERNSADAYAGPGKSFPLFSSGAHLHAAWMLAGHAADPAAVRARIKSFAKAHGLTHLLPDDAQDDAQKPAMKANDAKVRKLLDLAYHHESLEGDAPQKQRLIQFAQENGLSDALPDDAHHFMHEQGIPHGHPGDEHDGMPSLHDHPVQKAVNVVAKTVVIEKAYEAEDGTTIVEGWTSTEDQDAERDIVPPECFVGALDEYMARKGPLSSEHDTRGYPVGHAQRVALVRDGRIFKSAQHPDDPADFEHFPASGTGMYGRYAITDPVAATAVKKGNVGGFSWIGNLREFVPLPGGGRRFISVYPLRENTVAAYPINGKAVLTAVKAFEADLLAASQGDSHLMDDKLEELLRGAAAAVEREERERAAQAAAAVPSVSKADLEGLLTAFKNDILSAVDDKVQKALPVREEGAGRRGAETSADPREADPATYIVKKAREVYSSREEGVDLVDEDKALAWGITFAGLADGLRY